MGAGEADEACVYPSGMIPETGIKSRAKLRFAGAEGRRHFLARCKWALVGDYANVPNACQTNLVDYGNSIAIFRAGVYLEVDLSLRTVSHGVTNCGRQVAALDLVCPKEDVAIAGDTDKHGILAQGAWQWSGVLRTSEINRASVGMWAGTANHENHE